jgi:hypothetical protein
MFGGLRGLARASNRGRHIDGGAHRHEDAARDAIE